MLLVIRENAYVCSTLVTPFLLVFLALQDISKICWQRMKTSAFSWLVAIPQLCALYRMRVKLPTDLNNLNWHK